MSTRKILGFAVLSLCLLAVSATAQPWVIHELPKFTEPPELDGVRGSDEWANTLHDVCSPSRVRELNEEFGWFDEADQRGVMGYNQLLPSNVGPLGPDEDEDEAGTDADMTDNHWWGWDEDGLYYLHEVRDNFRDIEDGGNVVAWWERDTVSIYLDMLNIRDHGPQWNVLAYLATDQDSDSRSTQYLYHDGGGHLWAQEGEAVDGFEYGFRDAGSEFGGDADYVIEGTMPWESLMRWNLPEAPTAGSVMAVAFIVADPDGNDGLGGQMQCWGIMGGDWANDAANWVELVYTDTPAGPGSSAPTAAAEDSWGRIKATFSQ